MKIRMAVAADLPALEMMFKDVVRGMHRNGIKIWNEVYPCVEFADDIASNSLHLITKADEIVAAFGLYDTTDGKDRFDWRDRDAKAVYPVRVGVNAKYLKQGIGTLLMACAADMAKQKDARFVRVLVSEDNTPAIQLYKKCGFIQVAGVYMEFSKSLNKHIVEIGFEKPCV